MNVHLVLYDFCKTLNDRRPFLIIVHVVRYSNLDTLLYQ